MQRQRLISIVSFAGSLMLFASCSTTIAYKPLGGTAAAAAHNLALKVADERPADHGGGSNTVGKVRGSYGIPASVTDSNPSVVTDTVSQATADALAQAGVGVQGGGSQTLAATVKSYWMDGFQGYKGTVTVQYALLDASGTAVWSKEISGGSGGALIFKSASSMTQDIFGAALSDLANKAAAEFKSAEFQKALK